MYHDKAPFTGYGVWICFEMKFRKVQMIHPSTFTEIMLSEYEYVKSSGKSLWPVNNSGTIFNLDRFVARFKERIDARIRTGKSFPVQTVAKILAEFDDTTVEQATRYLKSLTQASFDDGNHKTLDLDKNNREYALRKDADISGITGRPLAIVEAFRDNGPSSIYRITELVTGRVKTKMKVSRVVTYFVHQLTIRGVLEIVG